ASKERRYVDRDRIFVELSRLCADLCGDLLRELDGIHYPILDVEQETGPVRRRHVPICGLGSLAEACSFVLDRGVGSHMQDRKHLLAPAAMLASLCEQSCPGRLLGRRKTGIRHEDRIVEL